MSRDTFRLKCRTYDLQDTVKREYMPMKGAKTLCTQFLLALLFLSAVFLPGMARSQGPDATGMDMARVYEFVIRWSLSEPEEWDAMSAEFRRFSPAEMNEIMRLRRGLHRSSRRHEMSAEKYRKLVGGEEFIKAVEEIVLKRYNKSSIDLPEDEIKIIIREVMTLHPEFMEFTTPDNSGAEIEAQAAESCPIIIYPNPYYKNWSPVAHYYAGSSVARVVNQPAEWPCDYEVRYDYTPPPTPRYVWATTADGHELLELYGFVINGRPGSGNHAHLIYGYWGVRWLLNNDTTRLMNEILVW
jgi:hypothetical protein